MFLYEQPVLLTKEDHGTLGLSKIDRPFDFVKSIKGVPLVAGEIQSVTNAYQSQGCYSESHEGSHGGEDRGLGQHESHDLDTSRSHGRP